MRKKVSWEKLWDTVGKDLESDIYLVEQRE